MDTPEFNSRLSNIENAVENCYRKLLNNGVVPTPDRLRQELDKALNKESIHKLQTLFEFIEKFIEQIKPLRKEGSIKIYEATLKHLKEFGIAKKRKVNFEHINLDFYNDFLDYLAKDKGLLKNTAGKYIKNIKVFLTEATERGINSQHGL